MQASLPIGVFDSGVGGLTVLKAMRALLPNENLVYLGDTARVPYGTKSKETIARYAAKAAQKLLDYDVKMIVIACNTATSAALPAISSILQPLPVMGVIEPGAEAAVNASRNGSICVIATEATINGNAYQEAIGRLQPDARIIAQPCTMLVPLAEEGWLEGEIAEKVISRYLEEAFKDEKPDTLLLGCTHFPLFRKALEKVTKGKIAIVDSASASALHAQKLLAENGLLNPSTTAGSSRFLTTDNRERFARTGRLFLEQALETSDIELVDL